MAKKVIINRNETFVIPKEYRENVLGVLQGSGLYSTQGNSPLFSNRQVFNGDGSITITPEMEMQALQRGYSFKKIIEPKQLTPINIPLQKAVVEPLQIMQSSPIPGSIQLEIPKGEYYQSERFNSGGVVGEPESGIIKGPGTGKSDSIISVEEEGTLIVPVEKVSLAKRLYKKYISKEIPVAKPSSTGEVVRISNNEFKLTNEDLKTLEEKGVDISSILPDHHNTTNHGAEGMVVEEKILEEGDRSKLDGIVEKMIANKESDENIQFVVGDFKDKYGKLKSNETEVKKKVQAEPLSPFIAAPTGQKDVAYQPEGLESEIPSTSNKPFEFKIDEPTALKTPQTVGTGTGGTAIHTTEKPKTVTEDKFGEDFVNALAAGSSRLGSSIARTPSLIYEFAALPQNIIAKYTGLPIATSAEEFAKTTGLPDNKIAEYYDNAVLETKKKINEKYDKSITDYFANGEYEKGFKSIALQVAESAPISASLALGNAAGVTTVQSILGGGSVFAADKLNEIKNSGAPIDEVTAVTTAVSNGLLEGIFEQFGITKLGGITKDILKKEGKEAAKELAEKGFKESYGQIAKKYLGIGAEESISEAATQFAQNAVDKYSGYRPDIDLMDGVKDAAIVGLASAGAFSSAPLSAEVYNISKNKEKAKELIQQKSIIENDIANPSIPDQTKEELANVSANINEQLSDLHTDDKTKFQSLSDEDKSIVIELNQKASKLESAITDPNLSDTGKELLQQEQQVIQEQLKSIESKPLKPQENATKEREVEQDNQPEYIGTDAQRKTAETGDSNIPIESREIQKEKEVTSYPKRAQDFAKEEGFVPASEQEMQQYVSEKSEDPIEIIETFKLASPESKKSYKETILEENAIKVDKESYERFGDPKKVGAEMARQFFSKPKGAETKIDVIAENLSSQYGVEITPNDIVEYIEGAKYERKLSDTQVKLRDRFTKITGLPFSEKSIKKVYEEQAKKEQIDLDKYLNKEANDYETARKEYLERIRSGEIPISEYEPVGDVTSDTGLQGREGEKGRKEKIKSDRAYQSSKQLLSDVLKKVKDELNVAFKDISEIKFSEEKGDWIDQNNNVIPQLSPESERVLDAINVVSEGENLLSIIKNIVKGETSLGKQLAGDKEVQEVREQVEKGLKDKLKKINDALSEKKKPGTKTDTDNIIQAKILPVKEIIQAGFKPINKVQEKLFGEQVDKVKEWVAKKVKEGNQSTNNIKRWGSQFITSWSNGIPRTQKDLQEKRLLKGGISLANDKFEQALKKFHQLVGNNVESLERIHQVLDPEFYDDNESLFGKKVAMDDLTPNEKALAQTLRDINDYIHDWNFSMGLIDIKTYLANKDKYIARLYNAFEIPEDAQSFLENNEMPIGNKRVKLITDIFKAREEITEWKKNNIVRDPVYLTMKRMRETEVNASILSYIDHIAQQRGMISKEPKKGFTQLNGKAYGKLNEMYVPNYIAEDFQGFFFGNQIVDLLYDVSKVYDRNQVKQFFKKWYTVFSPTVQLGNNSSNFVFAFLSGIDPITMASKYPKAFKELREKGDVYNLLVKNGILGSDVVTGDLRPMTAKTEAITKEVDKIKKGILDRASKIDKKITDIYGGSDDLAKISAFMSLKEYGYSDAKAIELVYNGFQNYSSVGKIWDLASKTPLIGNPFIKFQADLQRIIANAALRRPLSTAMFIGILKGLATIASNWSDEDEKEKEIREGRKFIPKIKLPDIVGGDVPLVYKTPAGEVNLARFLSPYYSYDVGDLQSPLEEFTKYLPYQVKLVEGREAGSQDVFFPKQDPLIGTWWAAIIDDMDFREQSIQDPTATKYRTSGATPIEKSLNAMNYIARAQVPLYSNAMDMYTSWNYGVDFYNRSKSPGQVFMSTFVKVQDFKNEDYKKTIVNEKKNIYYKVQGLNKQMGDIKKDASEQIIGIKEKLKDGKISQKQFDVKYEEIIKTKDKRQSVVIDKIAQEQQKMNELTTKYANILR